MLTRGAQVTGVAVCGLCLTWISVTLRFYVRIWISKSIGREDWLTVAAMILFTLFCALLLVATNYGLGAHIDAIPDDMLETAMKYIFICELLYVVTTAVAKVSIGVYFFRLTSRTYQSRIIHANLAVVMLVSTVYFFFLLFQCSPVSYIWAQYSNEKGHCLSKTILANVTYAHAAMSALTDWVFGILPVFFVWKLKMDRHTKLSVILVLSLGFFASTATIVRIFYIHQLQMTTDYSWYGINLAKWSIVEPAIGITAAAIATLRPLFMRFLSFSAKRFPIDESATSIAEDLSHSNESQGKTPPHRKSGQEWSPEFAEMLGLSRFGVTTKITAEQPPSWWQRRHTTFQQKLERKFDGDSGTALNEINGEYTSAVSSWNINIKRSMTVVVEG